MKRNLLYCLLFMLPVFLSAQITSGDKLSGNIVGTDLDGNTVNVQEWLDDGKIVIIDIFATWCGPCWSFHTAGTLESLYEQYGPEGTDEIRVLGLEGDGSTITDCLYGLSSCNGTTLGDWTEGVKYPIMDDHTHDPVLNYRYFPTLYIINPDGTVLEVGSNRFNDSFWNLALFNDKPADLASFSSPGTETFCDRKNISETVEFYNMGTDPITSAKFELLVNGESKEVFEYNEEIPVFSIVQVETPKTLINETSLFEVNLIELNGSPVDQTDFNTIEFLRHKTNLTNNTFKLAITTDFYAGETSWSLSNELGDLIAEDTYQPGNDDQFGGGGPDANTTHEYDITVEELTSECLYLRLNDSYGDGMSAFNTTHPIPGVEIYDNQGNILKEKFISEAFFESTSTIFNSADFLSSANDVNIVNAFEVSPNPTSDVLNINVDLAVDSKASMSVVNMFGQNVLTFDNVQNQVDVSALPNGNYSLVVKTKEGVASQRFVKL